MSRASILWASVHNITVNADSLSAGIEHAILSAGQKLTALKIELNSPEDRPMKVIISDYPNLTPLSVSVGYLYDPPKDNSTPKDEWLTALAEHCTQLEAWTLQGYTFAAPALNNLIQGCRKLCVLHLSESVLKMETIRVMTECDIPMENLQIKDALELSVAQYQRLFSRRLCALYVCVHRESALLMRLPQPFLNKIASLLADC